MTLSTDEFIRRFLLHVLPKGFHRIRHYALLASTGREANVTRARELLAVPAPAEIEETEPTPDLRPPCPCCGGRMVIIEIFQRAARARAPPSSPPFTGATVS
jgi:Putative transposase